MFWVFMECNIFELKEYIDQRIRNNRRLGADETASKIDISHGKKPCKKGLRPKRKRFILT
jgi:hypothetical protein